MLTEYDVFISYSSKDSDFVQGWLLPRLEQTGLRVCIDSRDFDIGVAALTNMENAVERSRKTLLVLTPNWLQSEWTNFESLLTQTNDPAGVRQRTLPLVLDEVELPRRLGILTYADFRQKEQWDSQLLRLLSAIGHKLNAQSSATAATTLQPNLVHPYPLQANFTGRLKERAELTAWLADEEYPIYELVAMGGMGKSALTWVWLTQDVLKSSDVKLDGVMWWSFYEGESSFAKFVEEALKYVADKPVDLQQFPTTYDRSQELRKLLQNKRILFLLDGFERQLRAYANLDAAYEPHDQAESSTDARSCVDPNTSRLLRDIAAITTQAKVLLTSRLPVSDLQDRAGGPLAGVVERDLRELFREDAIAFMRAQGITNGTDAEIANACESYGYHALSLRLLSGLIAHDAKLPGDISAAPRHQVFDDLIQRQHHVLEKSYEVLPKRERALLSRIAAFRGSTTYDDLMIFNVLGSEERFAEALEDLRIRGLLQREKKYNRFDLHPIVRHFAYERLADKATVHSRLRDHFGEFPLPEANEVRTIEDLATAIELYHHTIGAGQHEAALLFYYRRIWNPLYYGLGAYQTQIALLRPLHSELDRLSDESHKAWVLNELGNAYALSGKARSAFSAFQEGLIHSKRLDRVQNEAISLSCLSGAQVTLGEFESAERSYLRSIELSLAAKDKVQEATSRQEIAELYSYQGDFDKAEKELATAQRIFDDLGPQQTNFVSVVRGYRALRALLMGDAVAAFSLASEARSLADEVAKQFYPHETDVIRSEFLLGAALIYQKKEMDAAFTHINDALVRSRRISLGFFEVDILLALARWHFAQGTAQEAQASAEDALATADRCEHRLKQADIHNFLAQLALNAGDEETAYKEAGIAKERAWCDGPPHCYKPALDEAERMLKELGAD